MSETTTTRRLRRSTTDRNLAGVAGGLGQYLGIDPVLIRVLLVLLVFAGGAGILFYLVAWVVLPEDDGSAAIAGAPLSRDATTVAGVVVLALAATILLNGWWWTGDLFLPLLLVGVGAWLLLRPGDDADDAAGDTADQDQRVPIAAAASTRASGVDAPVPPPPPGGATGAPVPPPPVPPAGPPTARVTVGVVALVAGAFGVAHAAGADVSVEAVLLTCLAVTAAGLLIGAFTGRARGLIALAVPLVVALSVVSAVDIPLAGGMGERRHEPATLAELDDTYELTGGTLILDLRRLSAEDLSSVSGPTSVAVRLGFGEVTIFTPPDLTIRTDVEVTGGQVDLYGAVDEGTDVDVRDVRAGPDDAPVLELLVDVGFGEVTVR